jgi:hypothetical protein
MNFEKLFKFFMLGHPLQEEKYFNEYNAKGDQTYFNE